MDTAKKPEEIKLSKSGRIRFTAGFFVCAILWMTGLAIVSAVLLPQHLRDIAGEAASTTIFGYVNAATAIASLVANLLFGNLSDRTRSRFGRRTPWIFWGAILAGVTRAMLDTGSGVLNYRGKRIELTKNEWRILQSLLENKGKAVSRDMLMMHLWESDSFIDDNTLTVNVTRLRKKLEEAGLTDFIQTKKGVGYLIA